MRTSSLLGGLAALALGAVATPAAAVVITGTTTTGGNVVTPVELSSSQISVDVGVYAFAPITVNFGVQAGDDAGYSFDSSMDIFTGVGPAAEGVATLFLTLTGGATFDLGTVTPSFSRAVTTLSAAGDQVTIRFTPSETNNVTLGSLDSLVGDFRINRNGLAAGSGFGMTIAAAPVPEPATWAMMIGGVAVAGTALRRTRRPALARA